LRLAAFALGCPALRTLAVQTTHDCYMLLLLMLMLSHYLHVVITVWLLCPLVLLLLGFLF
jgi:hypothetical protein